MPFEKRKVSYMKLRTIGAVLAGMAMIGATLAGAVASADAPPKSFWIDPATGQPNVVIAVGASANASDVVSASLIGAMVGNMATVQDQQVTTRTATADFDNIAEYPYGQTPNVESYGDERPAKWYTDFELLGTQLWNTQQDGKPDEDYDITVALALPKEIKNGNNVVAKGLSTLWFANTAKEWDSKDTVYNFKVGSATGSTRKYWLVNQRTDFESPTDTILPTLPAYAGGSYSDGDGEFDLDYGMYTTKAWVNVGDQKVNNVVTYAYDLTDDCDYIFGGTGTGMEAHEEVQLMFGDLLKTSGTTFGGDGKADLLGDQGYESGIIYRTTEIRYPLLENGQNICGVAKCDGMIDFETAVKGYFQDIKFLGKYYTPMFAGATYNTEDEYYLGAYFVYGKPYAQKETIIRAGENLNFHGWTITLNDVNIYENKAYITVSGPALNTPFTFIMVMDSLGACGPCCPECATYGGGGAFTSNPTNRNEYDPYMVKTTVTKTKDGYDYDYFRFTNFMLDGIKTFVGADGSYLAEFNLYAVEDVGYLEDKGCCDPFVTTPNDYGLAITGGWRKVSYAEKKRRVEIGEKTFDIPAGWVAWEDTYFEAQYTAEGTTIPVAYIQWMPEPAYNAPCPDGNFDTLELRLCDDINIPDCETSYSINGPENYFRIEIVDVDYGEFNGKRDEEYNQTYSQRLGFYGDDDDVDVIEQDFALGGVAGTDKDGLRVKISQTAIDKTIDYTRVVPIDPVELIKLDIEVNTNTLNKNLVLIGGPVFNSLVKDLQNIGASTVNWATSPGEWEWIADPYGKGYDALIVAGANREETRLATQMLVNEMG